MWFSVLILVLSLNFSSIVAVQAEPQSPSYIAPSLPVSIGLGKRLVDDGNQRVPNTSITDVTKPLSPPSLAPALGDTAAQKCNVEAELETQTPQERVEDEVEERRRNINEELRRKPFWLDDDDLPPMMWDLHVPSTLPFLSFSSAIHTVFVSVGVEVNKTVLFVFIAMLTPRCPIWHAECNINILQWISSSTPSSHSHYSVIVLGWAGELLLCPGRPSKSFSAILDELLHELFSISSVQFKNIFIKRTCMLAKFFYFWVF